jgi:hypothetical protein
VGGRVSYGGVGVRQGLAVVVVVGWGAMSSGECNADASGGAGAACADAAGGAVAALPAASGGSVAPAGGGAFDSVAASSGGGGVACGGGIVGSGEGGEVVNSGAVGNGCDRRDVRRDGAKGSVVVKHDRDGGGANHNKAAHFVGWADEGAANLVWVVKNGDPLLVVRREEKAKGILFL